MADSIVPLAPTRSRRKSADTSTAPAVKDRVAPASASSAFWEQLANRTGLAVLAFDDQNTLRLMSPAASRLTGVLAADVLGRPAHGALAGVSLVDSSGESLADVIEFPARRDTDGRPIGTVTTGSEQFVVHVFPLDFESDGRSGRALLFEPVIPTQDERGDHSLDAELAHTLREIMDVADALRQKTRRVDSETHRALAQTIYADAHRMRQIVADAGTLREAHAPTAAFHPEPLELGDLVMDLLAEGQQSEPTYQFELALPGELPLVTADAQRVRQALAAVLRFALAASAPGGAIRVAVRPHDDKVTVSMRTYRGDFPRGTLDSMLQPFAHIVIGSETIALGLELPLARALVALHGGVLGIETAAPEAGVVAHVTLPRLPLVVRGSAPATGPLSVTPDALTQPVRDRREVGVVVALGDARLARYFRANLEVEGYHCCVVADTREAERRIDQDDPDIVLLDTGLTNGSRPDETLRHLRSLSSADFLMLASRHDPQECARLLDLGAADYLIVPLSLDELLARIRVILRARERSSAPTHSSRVLRTGGLVIDVDRRSVTVDDRQVALSKTEFKLLRTLAEHAGMVLSHEMLLARVWGPGYGQEVEFAWVYVRRLRKKIEADPAHPRYILTIPGVGYKLATI